MDTKTGIGAEKPPGRCSGQLQTHILLSKIQADDRALPRNQNHEQIEAEATQLIKAGRWRALFSSYTWGFFLMREMGLNSLQAQPLMLEHTYGVCWWHFLFDSCSRRTAKLLATFGCSLGNQSLGSAHLAFLIRVFRSTVLINPHWQQWDWDEIYLVTSTTTKHFSGWCWGI